MFHKMGENFLAIDFETANQRRDSACSIGLVRVEKNEIVHQAVHLIRPPYKDFLFTHIHGIRWKDVADSPDFGVLWQKISPIFEGVDFLAAHNARFDAGVLSACCKKYQMDGPALPFTCTVELARKKWNIYPTKLPDVCRHLNIKLNHHEALSDALACARIVMASSITSSGASSGTAGEVSS